MKKVLFTITLLASGIGVFAQKFNDNEMNKLQLLVLSQNKLEDGKTAVDKFAADPANASNQALDMARLLTYGRLYLDSTLHAKYPNAGDVAYGIFKNYQNQFGADTAKFNKLLNDHNRIGLDGVSNIYVRSFNLALREFNSQNYTGALKHFRTAEEISEFLLRNGFSQNPDRNAVDTATVLYAGFAAQNASVNNPALADSAAYYYTKLLNRNIITPEMAPAYQFMLERAIKNKDKASVEKWLPLAKKTFPDYAALWSKLEMDNMSAGAALTDLLAKFNEADAAGTLDENGYLNFAETLSGKGSDSAAIDQMIALKSAGAKAYGKLFEKTKDPLYGLNAAIVNYQIYQHLEDEFRANTGQGAALKAKRDEILKQQHAIVEKSIEWYQKAIPVLEGKTDRDRRETSYLRNAYRNMTNLFEWKASKARGVQPQLVDKYEAEFNKYNKLFDSLSK